MEKITTKEMAKSIHSTHSFFLQEGTLPLLKGNESKEKDKGNAESRENPKARPR